MSFNLPYPGDYVNSLSARQQHSCAEDVVNSYNDGPLAPASLAADKDAFPELVAIAGGLARLK